MPTRRAYISIHCPWRSMMPWNPMQCLDESLASCQASCIALGILRVNKVGVFQHIPTHSTRKGIAQNAIQHRNFTGVKFPNILATTASIRACVLRDLKSTICMWHSDFVWFCIIQERTEFEQSRATMKHNRNRRAERIFQLQNHWGALGHHVKSPTTRRNCRRKSSQVGHLQLSPSQV